MLYHFFNKNQTESHYTHSSPSLLFASIVEILKRGVLTGRSVKAIPVGGKILELKRQRIFFLLGYILNMLQNAAVFQ